MSTEVVTEQLVARLRALLETPEGIDEEPAAPDLFTLLAELAALKSEVKIESRQVKSALEQFGALFDTLKLTNERQVGELAACREAARAQAREAERGLFLELLDVRDRLADGHAHARGYRPGWLARRSGADRFVAAMADGLEMNLRRLDETLLRRDVRPIPALDRRFDPRLMSAVEVVASAAHRPNEVVAEVRRGYRRGDELLRVAEVVVNKMEDPSK